MLLMLDNYDSFTYNLVQYLNELGVEVIVRQNDRITLAEIKQLQPERIILSPGPGTPEQAGITLNVIEAFATQLPILGICLGHQAIAQAFGGKVVHAKKPMHGKISAIHHNNQGVLKGLKNPFNATRYHSLLVEKKRLPTCFELTAWTIDANNQFDEIMGIRHKEFAIEGVQFHPESIMTEFGHAILKNFITND